MCMFPVDGQSQSTTARSRSPFSVNCHIGRMMVSGVGLDAILNLHRALHETSDTVLRYSAFWVCTNLKGHRSLPETHCRFSVQCVPSVLGNRRPHRFARNCSQYIEYNSAYSETVYALMSFRCWAVQWGCRVFGLGCGRPARINEYLILNRKISPHQTSTASLLCSVSFPVDYIQP